MRTSNGHSVTYAGATVTDAGTYKLPDGRLVRAFLERLDQPEPVVYLQLPQDFALDDLASCLAGGDGRIKRMPRAKEPPEPTGWTLADLASADAAAWDDAVTRLGGKPWIPEDGMRSTGESNEEAAAPRTEA